MEVMLDMAPESMNMVSGQMYTSAYIAACHQQKLEAILDDNLRHLSHEEANAIKSDVLKLHAAFVLEDGEPGETDLTRFNINTRDAQPKNKWPIGSFLLSERKSASR